LYLDNLQKLEPLKQIKKLLSAYADKNNIEFFARAVPGEQKIYGVKTPVLNEIVKKFAAGSFDLAEELWNSGALEEKVIAVKIIEKKGKTDPDRTLKLFKQFSKSIDNWAVCDGLGMQFLSGVRMTKADEIFDLSKKFSKSSDPWQRRLSLVMVEWYTRKNERIPEIKNLVNLLENDQEYYVKKAVTWIKKNFAKGK